MKNAFTEKEHVEIFKVSGCDGNDLISMAELRNVITKLLRGGVDSGVNLRMALCGSRG